MSSVKKSVVACTVMALGISGAVLMSAAPASAHGHIGGTEGLQARHVIPENGVSQDNKNGLEHRAGFPNAGPADGKLASVGLGWAAVLDEQSESRWAKNDVAPGSVDIEWQYSAPHNTEKWHYYITKTGWDPNDALDRGDFEPLTTIQHDGSSPTNNPVHTLEIPSDRYGYHVIYAAWDTHFSGGGGNAFYNVIDVNIAGDGQPDDPDTEAPTVPSGLAAPLTTHDSVELTWNAASDNVGVTGYEVFRDGEKIATVPNTRYTDTGRTPDTEYRYTVRAVDAATNTSAHSRPLTATTLESPEGPDTEAPTPPTSLHHMRVTATSIDLMWNHATDNVGVTKYKVWDGTAWVAETAGTNNELTLTGLTPSTSYNLMVHAFDAAGNMSAGSNILLVDTAEQAPVVTVSPSQTVSPTLSADATGAATVRLDNTGDTDSDPGVVTFRAPSGTTFDAARVDWTRALANGKTTEGKSNGQLSEDRKTLTYDRDDLTVVAGKHNTYTFTLKADNQLPQNGPITDGTITLTGGFGAGSASLGYTAEGADDAPTYPVWDARAAYTKGDKVTHEGDIYEAVQSYQGNGDPNWITAASLWKKL